ncbi:hypothetical protein RYA05_06045 [Pseudomonas syringae pv. actinidiae]|nr:hypothetical protein [Pseudomonas syringae pv. actinidiae]
MKKIRTLAILALSLSLATSPLMANADTLRYRYSITSSGNALPGPGDLPTTPPGPPGPVDGWLYFTEVSDWQNMGEPFGCSEWLPSAATIPSGVSFQQTATGCSVNQERQTANLKRNTETGEQVFINEVSREQRTVSGQDMTQNMVGTNQAFSVYVYGSTSGQVNESFKVRWNSNGATSYKIRGSSDASGIPTAYEDLGTTKSTWITPTAGGKYTYEILATNASGQTASGSIAVDVVDFQIKNFVIAESEVSPGDDLHLSWEPIEGAEMKIVGEKDVTGLSSTTIKANTRSGSNLYILSATKTVDGKELYTTAYAYYQVVGAPYMQVINYPKIDEAYGGQRMGFNVMWTSDTAVRYTIRSNNDASGMSTTPIPVARQGTETSMYSMIPNIPGKYVITITGYNKFGASSEIQVPLTVVDMPQILSFSADRQYASPGENVTLNWKVIGSTNTYIYGLGPVEGNSLSTSVGDTPGNKAWTLSANAKANNQNTSSEIQTSVTVVANPTLTLDWVPTTPVQVGQPFMIKWTATDFGTVTQAGSSDESGWPVKAQPQDGWSSQYYITPTAPGTYSYSVTITNRAGKSVVKGFLAEVQ